MEERIVGGRDRTPQRCLLRAPLPARGEMLRLFEKIGCERHAVLRRCGRSSDSATKLTDANIGSPWSAARLRSVAAIFCNRFPRAADGTAMLGSSFRTTRKNSMS